MALVSAAYARLLPRLWQEMLMEHICIVKWAHHKIVWPSQGFARRADIFFWYHCINKVTHWHRGYKLCHLDKSVQQCSVYFEGWWSLVIYGLPCPCLCPLSAQASQLDHSTPRYLSLWLHMHWGLYTCYVQELVAEAATKAVWKTLHLVLLKDDKKLLPLHLWDIQWENLAAKVDLSALSCQTTYRVKYSHLDAVLFSKQDWFVFKTRPSRLGGGKPWSRLLLAMSNHDQPLETISTLLEEICW